MVLWNSGDRLLNRQLSCFLWITGSKVRDHPFMASKWRWREWVWSVVDACGLGVMLSNDVHTGNFECGRDGVKICPTFVKFVNGVFYFCIKMLAGLISSVIATMWNVFSLFCCKVSQYTLIYIDKLTNKLQFCFFFVMSMLLKNWLSLSMLLWCYYWRRCCLGNHSVRSTCWVLVTSSRVSVALPDSRYGDVSPTFPKDQFWDLLKSSKKLVRVWGYHSLSCKHKPAHRRLVYRAIRLEPLL